MAKRFSLREFQQNVLNRLQQQEEAGSHASTLGVQVGNDYWLVEMEDISEVLPMPPLTFVPLTKPWYRGARARRMALRGGEMCVCDLAAFLGLPEAPQEGQSRVLLVNPKFAFNAGLVVTRVLGLRDTAGWQHTESAEGMDYQDEQGHTWHKLDINRLLQQPEFLQIGV